MRGCGAGSSHKGEHDQICPQSVTPAIAQLFLPLRAWDVTRLREDGDLLFLPAHRAAGCIFRSEAHPHGCSFCSPASRVCSWHCWLCEVVKWSLPWESSPRGCSDSPNPHPSQTIHRGTRAAQILAGVQPWSLRVCPPVSAREQEKSLWKWP